MAALIEDVNVCERQLAIVERYEDFVNYVYPIALNMSRRHHVLRDMFVAAVLAQPRLFIEAGKTSQISKLYAADAGLATLRFYLRVLAHPARKLITPKNNQVASGHLAEVGGMLGAWIKGRGAAKG